MSSPSWIGRKIADRYQIEALLGQGGMSAVYRAFDPNLNRMVAIKLIHPHLSDNPNFVERFKEEAEAVARLRHPNIVQVYDFNNDGDIYYMVMEYLAGETLQKYLKRINAEMRHLAFEEAIRYTQQICAAAGYAHQRDLVHRDIKPANIMLDVYGQPILMDFGIVKIVGGKYHTVTGATIGTAVYMSPEQIRSERVDERSDIYSIGVTLFEMLSGKPPYEADSALTLMMKHLNDPIPDLQQLRVDTPAELAAVAIKALAKERQQRFQTAGEMAEALRQIHLAPPVEIDQIPTEIDPSQILATPPQAEATPGMQPVQSQAKVEETPEYIAKPLQEAGLEEGVSLGGTPLPGDAGEAVVAVPIAQAPEASTPVPGIQKAASTERRRISRWLFPVIGLVLVALLATGAIWLINQRRPPELQLMSIERPPNPINVETLPRLVSLGQWQVDSVNEELAFSPDSNLLGAASNRDGNRFTLYRFYGSIWQVNPAKLEAQLRGHTDWLKSVDFSVDGALFATAGEDARIHIWQVKDGALLRTILSEVGGITNVAFAPNGNVLAGSTWDGVAGIWQLSNGNLLRTQGEDASGLVDVAFSPDGKLLAGASDNGSIFLWQMSDGALLNTMKGHTAQVQRVDFSPDGNLLASASDDKTVGLWRVEDGQLLATLASHSEAVTDVAFSADGSLLASSSWDGTLRLWQARDGLLLRTLEIGESVLSVVFSPDGAWLVCADSAGSIRFWGVSEAISVAVSP